jgi:predicted GIY-YIG superfamily endonuclease
MYYVYLIESLYDPSRRYVGFSTNLRQRLAEHNDAKLTTTASHRPWRLATYLAFSSKKQALAFENYLKSGSGHAFAKKRLW